MMRGKILFVAGLATGYVLGSRAGRQRYEQIKSGWLSVWHTAPVQNQVEKVQSFAKARVSEVPGMLYSGVRKVATVIASDSPAEPAAKEAKPAAKSAGTSTTKATGASKKSASTKPAAGSTGAGAKK